MNKIIFRLLPLIMVIFLTIIGILAIYQIKKENNLSAKFDNQEIVNLPEFSFNNLYENQDSLTHLDLKDKYSLLNIFASWCTTCYAEHDILVQIAQDQKIAVYGIAFRDIDKNTKKYLEENKNPYLKVGIDRRDELSKLLSIQGVPETFLINKKGQIIYRHQGSLTKNSIKYIYSKIDLK